jgi:small subunit ribosomal protein S14
MPKKSVRNRTAQRNKLELRYRPIRTELRNAASDIHSSFEKRMEASLKLQALPRDSSRCRARNRCNICGRPRSYYKKLGLCRLHMRWAIVNGLVPGIRKASW